MTLSPALLVTGTGTDIGKSIVLAALFRALSEKNISVQTVKIVQTGVTDPFKGDASVYEEAVRDIKREKRTPIVLRSYPLPSAPNLAAALVHERISLSDLAREIEELRQKTQGLLLLETAGGLHVPLNDDEDMLDLLRLLKIPVLLVAANTLGTLNHTLLSLDALSLADVPVFGLVLNDASPNVTDAEQTIAADNERILGLRLKKRFAGKETPHFVHLPFCDLKKAHAWESLGRCLSPLAESLEKRGTVFPEPDLVERDRKILWHPYTKAEDTSPLYAVKSASQNRITLACGQELIDGMSSWWCAIHGYNHPHLVEALQKQAAKLSHIMFGGFTHENAVLLAWRLQKRLPIPESHIFFSDSGSVAVEVAMKMALQYHIARGNLQKTAFLTPRGGYHGDTFAAMSVSDPENGMHHLFTHTLSQQYFMPRPQSPFGAPFDKDSLLPAEKCLEEHGNSICAVILEPVVQGAGGMYFYHPDYLSGLAKLCKEHDVLLIVDEIATGFGRTGKFFASEWASLSPDILCLGKGLTGGMLTLAATCASKEVARTISSKGLSFMHGPTFMANASACACALASLDLLDSDEWKKDVARIEGVMRKELESCRDFSNVLDVRVLGAIGVVETKKNVNMNALTRFFVRQGVWIRPFKNLIYLMPPYISPSEDVAILCRKIHEALSKGIEEEN